MTAETPSALPSLEIAGDVLRVGSWEADWSAVIETHLQLRDLMGQAHHQDAGLLLRSRSAPEQAALIALDERPEEVLSLTAMDAQGRPGYAPAVIDHIPSILLAELVAPSDTRFSRFNTALLATMSPVTLGRAIDDTLDPVCFHGDRSAVSWEWLEAVASLPDARRIADLLHGIDEAVLEEALIPRVNHLSMGGVVAGYGVAVAAFRALGEDSAGVALPDIDDEETAHVIRTLHEAAPDLVTRALRSAWERA